MTTATEQFDVDRCVNEDGKRCEVRPIVGATWDEATYIGVEEVDGGVGYVVRVDGALDRFDPRGIRNIQPKPRMLRLIIGLDHNCVPIIHRVGGGNIFGVGHTMPVDACEVTINLDTCEQVEPDVMTPDELWDESIIMIASSGSWKVHDWNRGLWWNGAEWASIEVAKNFPVFRAAQIEATRIAREGKHNA